MSINERQMGLEDVSPEYQAFVDKFKPKLTTDDCYTPENVYDTVRAWVFAHYGLPEDTPVVRPFCPGGDYLRADYPDGCVVIDNPPFSILAQIEDQYLDSGIPFFLFAPGTTLFRADKRLHYVLVCLQLEFANGAKVNTSFVTSLGEWAIETAPDLYERLNECNKANSKEGKRELPKYEYPPEVATAARLGWLTHYGVRWRCRAEDLHCISKLDNQGDKRIFGRGFLLSRRAAAERAAAERAAAERAAAIRWELSEREQKIINGLGAEK